MRSPAGATFRDHYAILGVGVDAAEAEIKAAYRERAKQCHPDLHPGDERAADRFRQISEARRVLLSPSARARFNLDRLEHRDREVILDVVGAAPFRWPRPAVSVAPRAPRVGTVRPGWQGALLLATGMLTVLLAVSVLPFVTITSGPEPVGVSGIDAGALAGMLNGCCCAVLAVLGWASWRGTRGHFRWEALLAFAVLWLLLVTAAEFDPHLLVGGFLSSDLTLAPGARLLPVGIALTVCGAWLLRPADGRPETAQPAAPVRDMV
jgi:DnaJ domain